MQSGTEMEWSGGEDCATVQKTESFKLSIFNLIHEHVAEWQEKPERRFFFEKFSFPIKHNCETACIQFSELFLRLLSFVKSLPSITWRHRFKLKNYYVFRNEMVEAGKTNRKERKEKKNRNTQQVKEISCSLEKLSFLIFRSKWWMKSSQSWLAVLTLIREEKREKSF